LRADGRFPMKRLNTEQGPVEFIDVGNGPPVLYFHGSGAGADVAIILEQPLIDADFRLIVPNRPGYNGTPIQSGRSSDECASLASAILDNLEIERVSVIGMSSGAMAATTFAKNHPQRTAALVLQCAMSHPIDSIRWMPARFRWMFPLVKNTRIGVPLFRLGYQLEVKWMHWNPAHLIAHTGGERRAELLADRAVQEALPRLIDSAVRCARQPVGVANDYRLLFDSPWLTPDCVKCPTLILHDLADPVARLPHLEWATTCIPQAEFCELHAGGHLIWFGRDAELMKKRRVQFLSDHKS
jgi:pimeloyl-ACP methyl ester carboxylesterase